MISKMSPQQKAAMKDKDRTRFKYPELFKNKGRASNPVVLIIRQAVDDYLAREKAAQVARENPGLFDQLDEGES